MAGLAANAGGFSIEKAAGMRQPIDHLSSRCRRFCPLLNSDDVGAGAWRSTPQGQLRHRVLGNAFGPPNPYYNMV